MDDKAAGISLSLKILLGAGALSAVAAATAWTGNPWIAGAGLALTLAGALVLGRVLAGPLDALTAGLLQLSARRRDFLFDLVRGWKPLGDLGRLVSENLEFNMQRREYYRGAVQAVGSPFFLCDPKGVITHASNSLMALLNKGAKDVLGQTVSRAFYGREGQAVTEEVLRTGQKVAAERDVTLWDGRALTLSLYIDCIRAENGQVLGAVASVVDVSLVKQHEQALEAQQRQLVGLGSDIAEVAQRVASASEELSASADEQARGAQRQKDQTESVGTAMEEMTATVVEVARNASQSADAAQSANSSAREGASLVRQAVEGIGQVAESSRRLAEVIAQLDAQSSEIDRIIGTISDIADQTNLLALNAAIEAARAGDAGRGFAVVADEVRKLAEKTMVATKEVENSIREIQERSRHAMANMKETERQVESSTDLSNRTGLALEDILHRIEDVNVRVAQIATAAEQQSSAAEEINRSIEGIADVARETEEGVAQSAAATRELAELSQNLLRTSMELASRKSDASRLRASRGEIKGILPKLMQDFIRAEYGPAVAEKVQETLGNPTFLPAQAYPDQVLGQMADLIQELTGKPARDVFLALGRHSIKQFHKMYKAHFKAANLKDFYLSMNETHANLTRALPGLKPPRFTYEDRGDRLIMTYHSSRGYPHYFEGILLGAAEFFKKRVDVKMTQMDKETARAEITFL